MCGWGQDAALAFEGGLELEEDHQCAYSLVLCARALGDARAVQAAFKRLAQVVLGGICITARLHARCQGQALLSSVRGR